MKWRDLAVGASQRIFGRHGVLLTKTSDEVVDVEGKDHVRVVYSEPVGAWGDECHVAAGSEGLAVADEDPDLDDTPLF